MFAVGCDFGLRKSGVVLLNENMEIESQNLILTKGRGAGRLLEVETSLDSILQPYLGTTRIEMFIEGYAYGAKYQRESLAELGGVMRRYLHLKGLDYWVVPPTEVKSFVTGTGRAKKNYMKKCTNDQWGIAFKSDDVCDAYGLSRLGMNILKKMDGVQELNLPEHQQSVVDNITAHPEYYKNSNTARKKPPKKSIRK